MMSVLQRGWKMATVAASTAQTSYVSSRAPHMSSVYVSAQRMGPRATSSSSSSSFRAEQASLNTFSDRFLTGIVTPPTAAPIQQRSYFQTSTESPQAPASTVPNSLAYEIIRGSLCDPKSRRHPPTAVLIHGVMGSRRNLKSFTTLLAESLPRWQFLLVDLRCHGESASMGPHSDANTVDNCAKDVHSLLRSLRLFPKALIGHSFGGKVALKMLEQASPLANAIQVWVLDTAPGPVKSMTYSREDSPPRLIEFLRALRMPLASRSTLVDYLMEAGFEAAIAQWAATNLKASKNGLEGKLGYNWIFDLDGIADMYDSYVDLDMWPLLEGCPEGSHVHVVKAENSLHRWGQGEYERLKSLCGLRAEHAGEIQVHTLANAGHWVHTDNPTGLVAMMQPILGNFA